MNGLMISYHNFVAVRNGVDAVGDGDDGGVCKILPNDALNYLHAQRGDDRKGEQG